MYDHMISDAELTGIVNVLVAVTFEEICAIDKEISELRGCKIHPIDELQQLCSQALEEHLLESVFAEDVEEAKIDTNIFFITGPNAFPEIPPELSEVIDILKLSPRKVNMDNIEKKLLKDFKKRIRELEKKIGDVDSGKEDIHKIEAFYSDLLNLYYDYDSWLPGKFKNISNQLMKISQKIEQTKLNK